MNFWDIIKGLITIYFLYYVICFFTATTVIYLTYRFWKFLLPKEEINIFLANAPVVWSKNCDCDNDIENK